MAPKANQTIFSLVVEIGQEYLGPVAERFMRRQITTHLGKAPEELTTEDIPKLVDWTRLAFAMLTKNEDHIQNFCDTLLSISSKHSRTHSLSHDQKA